MSKHEPEGIVEIDHVFVPDPNGEDECLYSPTGDWATTCYAPRQQHAPEPVECPDCWGDGVVYEPDGRNVQQRTPCKRCLGDGVVEADG